MKRICCINGDGTGPELMSHALRALNELGEYEFIEAKAGYACYRDCGTSIPDDTISTARDCDAVLFSAVTSPPNIPDYKSAIVTLRRELDLYANVRPCRAFPNTPCLRPDIDLTIVRENTEGMYSGIEWRQGDTAYSKRVISKKGSERILRYAFEYAKENSRKKVTVVHKANVMRETCGLFLETAREVANDYPETEMEDAIIDAMAMRLLKHPQDFKVIVTTNLFGDILSDEAAQLVGGLGMTPSGNYGASHALFEPTHGSSPKYAGRDVVNPCAMLLSTSMLLHYLGENSNAQKLDSAISKTLSRGRALTRDLGGTARTSEMVNEIIRNMDADANTDGEGEGNGGAGGEAAAAHCGGACR
jgi:methanogen homoisocitrate dehydrogenase